MSAMPPLPEIDFTRFYRFDELTQHLRAMVAARPQLASLESFGSSTEGREMWLVTLTNGATGPALAKPGYWIDGNTHAGEVVGSTACLYTIWWWLHEYGHDPRITDLIDHQTTYIAPRLCPDGAEYYLTTPYHIRSNTRRYPYPEARDGLEEADIDGDGRILLMRRIDPHGAWKASTSDPRVMRPRDFDETGGTYYTLLPEGTIRNYDGWRYEIAPKPYGIDMNRNYPHQWAGRDEEPGGGPYPLSEAEVRAEMDAWRARPNINGQYTYHSTGGVLLRPFSTQSDEALPTEDLAVYKHFGGRGQAITGYRHASTYHEFRYDPKGVTHGGADDSGYDLFGWFAFTPELWDLPNEAGINDRKWIEWDRSHPEEDDLAIMRWNDAQLGDAGFVDWHPFEHSQLGPVEIGGFPYKTVEQNPPPQYMRGILEKHAAFTLSLALASPRLALPRTAVTRLGEDTWQITVLLENQGFLPTDTSRQARKRQVVRPISVTLDLPEGADILAGKQRMEVGQLEGRAQALDRLLGVDNPAARSARIDWTLRAALGTEVALTAAAERAGTVHATLTLA
ncbi:MAG: carboxypeptidase [Ktedonobacterales bacterium]|nr:carboxypeptidase [Ktedonobacterales bacterium]